MIGDSDVRLCNDQKELRGMNYCTVKLERCVPLQCGKSRTYTVKAPADAARLALTSANYEKKRKIILRAPQSR